MSSADAQLAEVITPRLVLRRWKSSDREPFARLNADPQVMRYFPAPLSRAESDEMADRIAQGFAARGFGFYAAELRETETFIGFIGISVPGFAAHFTPCVEIGWRLAAEYWNCGLATEGARAVATHAFAYLGIAELVAFTTEHNLSSRRVMEKIGMTHNPADDFDHPRLEAGHPLRRHVLYRLRASTTALRRMFHGPGIENFDVEISKTVKLTESVSVDLRVEAFNIFNHAQFYGAASLTAK